MPNPGKDPLKTRIEKKQKTPPPLRPPPGTKKRDEDSAGPASFDLKAGERKPIRQAIRQMTVETPAVKPEDVRAAKSLRGSRVSSTERESDGAEVPRRSDAPRGADSRTSQVGKNQGKAGQRDTAT